jgi:hypothetical protein
MDERGLLGGEYAFGFEGRENAEIFFGLAIGQANR